MIRFRNIDSLSLSCCEAAKVRAVVTMLSNFTTNQDMMIKKVDMLEQAVASKHPLATLGGVLSPEALATAIDMMRKKIPFGIKPNNLLRRHPSVLIQEIEKMDASDSDDSRAYIHVYKHFEGMSYSVYKAFGFERNEFSIIYYENMADCISNKHTVNADLLLCKYPLIIIKKLELIESCSRLGLGNNK